MATKKSTSIAVTPHVRDKIKALLRGGQSYNDLLSDMADQYDPAHPDVGPPVVDATTDAETED